MMRKVLVRQTKHKRGGNADLKKRTTPAQRLGNEKGAKTSHQQNKTTKQRKLKI